MAREPLNSEIEDDFLSTVPGFENGQDEFADLENDNDDGLDERTDQLSQRERTDARRPEDVQDISGRTRQDPNKIKQQDDRQIKYDAHGNVVDAKGNIIAPAGRSRRLDEQNRRYKGLMEGKDKEITALKTQVAEATFLNGVPAKLGLNNDETAAALDMMALFKSNPGQFVQVVLAEAQAKGVDINKLLGTNVGAVNTEAITKLLDQRLAPFEKHNKAQEEAKRVQDAVVTRYETFMAKYPDAEPHQDAIANLMRTQGLSETEAYFRVREFALRNGMDFSQPLGPQLQALMEQGAEGNTRQPGRASRRRPIVNGRMPSSNQMTERRTEIASPDRSYGSIIEEALAEAGYDG